jgi:hypothetical protein
MRIERTCARLGLVIVIFCLLSAAAPSTPAQFGNEVSPLEIERMIEEKARELNLGEPRSSHASYVPFRRSDLAIYDWYREYQRGTVYWSAYSRKVAAVTGTIKQKWDTLGGARSELGFPISDELASRGADARDRYQLFERGRIHWSAQTNEATVYYDRTTICEGGNCPAHARFRVVLTGFANEKQTQDDPLQRDGKDDEVFLLTSLYQFQKNAAPSIPIQNRFPPNLPGINVALSPVRSVLYGDTNGQANPPRLRAGSASDLGGIRSGDRYPTSRPWQRVPALAADRLPLLLWEGDLVEGQNGVVIAPTIWEWDGRPELTNVWTNSFESALGDLAGGLAGLLADPWRKGTELVIRDDIKTEAGNRQAFMRFEKTLFDSRDRPIGLRESRDQYAGRYFFEPKVLFLTYRSAMSAAQASREWLTASGAVNLGSGIIPLTYQDDPGLGGSYTLFLQIERVP